MRQWVSFKKFGWLGDGTGEKVSQKEQVCV